MHPDPYKRYEELSEFVFELRHPNKSFLNAATRAADRAQSVAVLEMPLPDPCGSRTLLLLVSRYR